jgi:hypothetical protein
MTGNFVLFINLSLDCFKFLLKNADLTYFLDNFLCKIIHHFINQKSLAKGQCLADVNALYLGSKKNMGALNTL